jgi:hypothetical protein
MQRQEMRIRRHPRRSASPRLENSGDRRRLIRVKAPLRRAAIILPSHIGEILLMSHTIAIIGIVVAFGAFMAVLALTERQNRTTWKEFE